MTDFVLKIEKETPYFAKQLNLGTAEAFRDYENMFNKVINYANFLKQPLELWMFVPCDKDGNVLEEPIHIFSDYPQKEKSKMYQSNILTIEYQKAKNRVLFEGFKVHDLNGRFSIETENGTVITYSFVLGRFIYVSTIESGSNAELQLTQEALNQIGI